MGNSRVIGAARVRARPTHRRVRGVRVRRTSDGSIDESGELAHGRGGNAQRERRASTSALPTLRDRTFYTKRRIMFRNRRSRHACTLTESHTNKTTHTDRKLDARDPENSRAAIGSAILAQTGCHFRGAG